MDIFRRLREIKHYLSGEKREKVIRRRQFNMMVAQEITMVVRSLAAIHKVPAYVVMEHLLQVGLYYVLRARKDQEKRQMLQEHLIKVHLLGNELSDDEGILRLGDND